MTINKIMLPGIFSVILSLATFPLHSINAEDAEKIFFDPEIRKIEGWNVHIDPQLLPGGEHFIEGEQALKMLANNLQRIKILLPEKILKDVQTLEIWIEHKHPRLSAMQYHPSKGWLLANKHDPRLAKKVHITRAGALLSKQQMLKHPMVVLHELAHAYHDQILDFDNPKILKVFNNAKEKGLYEKVMLYTGREVRHYGLNNHKEFFAEATESYFYRNDFYPFVGAELKKYDPDCYALMVDIWGPLN